MDNITFVYVIHTHQSDTLPCIYSCNEYVMFTIYIDYYKLSILLQLVRCTNFIMPNALK